MRLTQLRISRKRYGLPIYPFPSLLLAKQPNVVVSQIDFESSSCLLLAIASGRVILFT